MTKVKMIIGTAVAFTVLAVAAWILSPSLVSDRRKKEGGKLVTVSVVFSPASRDCRGPDGKPDLARAVIISLKVGPDIHPMERQCDSPWATTIYPYRGQVVDVRAEQLYGKELSCRILQLGAPPVQRDRAGPGIVNCRHTVI